MIRIWTLLPLSMTLIVNAARAQAPPPLNLERIISMYVERNLELQAARYHLERTRADQIAARLRPNPGLSIAAENMRVSGPTAASIRELTLRRAPRCSCFVQPLRASSFPK